MINVSVHYPRSEGVRFDMDYYRTKHIPLVEERYGAALKGMTVLESLAGGTGDVPAPNVASAHFVFESLDALNAAVTPNLDDIMADIPNFTEITPILEISEIK